MGGCKSFFFFKGKRTRDFAFVSLCYGRSGEEMCMGYAMAASGRMQYDYKQTNSQARSQDALKYAPKYAQLHAAKFI